MGRRITLSPYIVGAVILIIIPALSRHTTAPMTRTFLDIHDVLHRNNLIKLAKGAFNPTGKVGVQRLVLREVAEAGVRARAAPAAGLRPLGVLGLALLGVPGPGLVPPSSVLGAVHTPQYLRHPAAVLTLYLRTKW